MLDELQRRDLWNQGTFPTEEQAKPEDHKDEMASDFRAAKRVAGDNVHKRNWGKK